MCITVRPSFLNNTITGIFFSEKDKNHYLIYQNTATNESTDTPGNCMPLYIRGTNAEAINTQDFKGFAKEIVDKYIIKLDEGSRSRGVVSKGGTITLQICGDYEILFCSGANREDIKNSFSLVSEDKRTIISDELLDFYLKRFDDCTLVLCFFNNTTAKVMDPILIKYKPTDFEYAIIPGADSHDGTPPKREMIERNHFLITGYDKDVINNYENKYSGPMYQVLKDSFNVPDFLRNMYFFVNTDFQYGKHLNGDWQVYFNEEINIFGHKTNINLQFAEIE